MAIREVVLILVVAAICCWALIRPQIGLYGYVWFAIMQPDVLAWCEGKYPFSMALALVTLLSSARHLDRVPRLFTNPFSRWLILMQIPIGLSILFSYGPFLGQERYRTFIAGILMAIMIPLLITTEKDMRILLLVIAMSLGLLGVKYGSYGWIHRGALFTGQMGKLYDNNTLAQALAMSLPLCWFSRHLWKEKWIRNALLVMVALTPAGIIMTNSRSASIAAAAGILLFVYRSKNSRLVIAVVFALAVGPAIYMVKDQFVNRMETLASYQKEQSAASRLVLSKAGFLLWLHHPLFGVGFGSRNYVAAIPPYLPPDGPDHYATLGAHNTYVQMVADSGIFTLLIFVGLLLSTIKMLNRTIRETIPGQEHLVAIPIALQLALVEYLIGAAFHSLDRYDLVYELLMCGAAWFAIHENLRSEAEYDLPSEETEHGAPIVAGVPA